MKKQPYSLYVWKVNLEAPGVVTRARDLLSSGSFCWLGVQPSLQPLQSPLGPPAVSLTPGPCAYLVL